MKIGLFKRLTLLLLLIEAPVASRAQEIAIRYSGGWTNLTFGSKGKAFVDVAVQSGVAILKFDLDGLVFGTFDPPLITFPGTVQNGTLLFDTKGVAGFGDITGNVNLASGATTINVTNVPNPSIAGVQLSGTITTKLDLQFSVDFPGPPSPSNPARGVIVAEGTRALRITALEVLNNQLTITWTGGTPPFQVQTASEASAPAWQDSGAPVSGTTAVIPITGSRTFVRVSGK